MAVNIKKINNYLTNIFNNVLVIEENSIKKSKMNDITIKEMHTIEAVGEDGATVSEIAKALMVTMPTVTISINRLEKKGYLERTKDDNDRRIVRVQLTKKGKSVFKAHQKFHQAMVEKIIEDLDDTGVKNLESALYSLHSFLEEVKDGEKG